MITKLSEIMECDPVTEKQKIVIFDFSNIAYRSVFSAIFADPFDNVHFNLFKHMLLNSFLTTISIIKPQKVIVAGIATVILTVLKIVKKVGKKNDGSPRYWSDYSDDNIIGI